MKSKLKIIIPLVVLLVLGGAYKVVLAKPGKKVKPHIDGQVYVLQKEFLINLADGHFAKLDAALVIPPDAIPAAGGEAAATPPDGYGALPQEAAVRAVITDTVSGAKSSELIKEKGRVALRKKALKAILSQTDVKAKDVLFTDVAVQ
jgi:flagellar basal body-associated protein FliL